MALHPLLQSQVNKHLGQHQNDPAILSFIADLDKELHKQKEVAPSKNKSDFLNGICAAMGVAVLIENNAGSVIFTNSTFNHIFKTDATPVNKEEIYFINSHAGLFSTPEKIKTLCNQLIASKQISDLHEVELSNGTILEMQYLPEMNGNKNFSHVWIFKDITEKKKAERSLHYLTNVQHTILNSTSFSIVYTTMQGVIISFNRVSEQLLGYKAADLIFQKTVDFLFQPEELETRAAELKEETGIAADPGFSALTTQARHGIVETREWKWVTASGKILTMHVSISSVKDAVGEIQGYLLIARDVSQQKEAEKALRISEARYRNMIERSSEIIYTTNKEGYFTFVNPVTVQLTGYSTDELLEMHYLELIRDDHRAKVQEFYKAQVASGTASTYYEFPIRNKQGDEIWIGQSLQLSEGSTGERELVALAIDITRQKEAEMSMIKSNEQLGLFRDLIDSSSDAISVATEDGRLFYLNNEARSRLGITESEPGNYSVADINPELKNPEEWKKYVRTLKNKFAMTYEGTNINQKTGYEFSVEVTVRYMNIDGKGYIIANSRDITARKRTETVLKTQEEKYRNIIANMNLGLLEVDLDEKIQYANQSFCQMSGYQQRDLVGRKAIEMFADAHQQEMLIEKTKQRQRELSDMYELQVKNKKGEEKWWMVSGAPNYNDEGQLIGSIGIHLDITEQKKLSRDLKLAISKAEEASRAKEAFLANMSHEIRTPLNGIIGMIRELSHEQLTLKQKKFVKNASMGSQHLLSILNNVLDISKIEAGELTLEQYPFNLGSTLKEVKQIMNSSAREKGLFIGLSTHEIKKYTYRGDAFRIRQALLNLVGNAIKFTQTGGVFIECKVTETGADAHQIEITVEDTGIGMDKEFQGNLFKKFSQEDSSISRKHGGTGLGMAITHELIQLMGGVIEVKSVKNQGTVMKISMKLQLSQQAVIGGETKTNHTDLGGAKILLVEDNEFNRAVATRSLKRHHCSITEATNGQEAIDILVSNNRFDVILMDLQMPVMGGIEATRIIRQQLKINTPIIALTANAFKSEIETCRSVGMNDHVTKPFEESVLVGLVARYKGLKTIVSETQHTNVPSDGSEKLYSLETLYNISQNDEKFVRDMVKLFSDQTREILHDIKTALEKNDYAQVSALAHKIKPGIDNMGITSLKQTIRQLETESKKDPQPKNIQTIFMEVERVLTLVLTQLEQQVLNK